MADEFGGLELPIAAPLVGEPVTDRALQVLGAYLSAMLTAWAGTAWATRAPNEPIVRTVLVVDPDECEFIESDLPALYLWRSEIDTNYLAEELTRHRSKIQVGWVPPPKLSGFRWAERATIINGVAKALTGALEFDRHKEWIDPGDPDPDAPTQGSVWKRLSGISLAALEKTLRTTVTAQLGDGRVIKYGAVGCQLSIDEYFEDDPSVLPGIAPSALDLSIVTPDYEVLLERELAPIP